MQMVSSVIRRQIRRYFGSVCKTARGNRWRFPVPWGDGACDGKACGESMKAVEGAERSLRTRRRKRGLRKGKSRSREGKSRRSTNHRPPDPNNTSCRTIMRACAQLDFWYVKEEAFVERLRRFKKMEDWSDEKLTRRGTYCRVPNFRYLAARAGWERIRKGMLRGNKALAPRCCSFRHLLESRVGVLAENVSNDLREWVSDYEFFRDARRELEIDPLTYDWTTIPSGQNLPSLQQAEKSNQASRRETKSQARRSTSSLTRGKPNGKRARPREWIKEKPLLVRGRGAPHCSHCAAPVPSGWGEHRCVQAWRRQR